MVLINVFYSEKPDLAAAFFQQGQTSGLLLKTKATLNLFNCYLNFLMYFEVFLNFSTPRRPYVASALNDGKKVLAYRVWLSKNLSQRLDT